MCRPGTARRPFPTEKSDGRFLNRPYEVHVIARPQAVAIPWMNGGRLTAGERHIGRSLRE